MTFIKSDCTLTAEDGELYRVNTQRLPDTFWRELSHRKNNFRIDPDGFTDAAVIPAAVADEWMAKGFNVFEADLGDILQRLRLEGYDDFIICKDTTF